MIANEKREERDDGPLRSDIPTSDEGEGGLPSAARLFEVVSQLEDCVEK